MKLYFPGGLNEQETPSLFECIEGYNFELGLKQSKLIPRKPIDKKGTAPNALAANGFLQLVKRDNSETTLAQAGDTVYLWDGASSFTSKGTVSSSSKLRDTYWSLGDYLVITDIAKATVIKKWDGTTFSTLTTGLGTDLYAKYGIVFQGRVWLFNVKTTTDTPHLMVASAFEDPTSYDTAKRGGPTTSGGGTFTTGLEAFFMLTPDLKPINGVAVFYQQLIISTEGGRLFKLTGSTAATFKWDEFYSGSAAIGTESMANIGNDVIYMKIGGGIDLLSSTIESGDVAADDVSRWIPSTTKDLASAITIYDQKNQKVLFFVSDKVLALFKDLLGGELSPWSVYRTEESFAFNTNAVKYMKAPGTQAYTVFLGDSSGRIFDLNGTGTSGDAGTTSIPTYRKTRYINSGEGGDKLGKGALNLMTKVLHGEVFYRRIFAPCDLTISLDWGDEYNVSSSVITLKGAPSAFAGVYYGGGSYYNSTEYFSQGFAFAKKVSSQTFSPTGKGPGVFISTSLETSTDFRIDHIDIH
jgi:hypothetical protein